MRGGGVDPIRCGRPGRAGGAPGWRRGNCARNGRAPVESLQPPLSGRHAGGRVVCWRYRFGSRKRPFYAGYCLFWLRICQFWPDILPIVGPKVLARHGASSGVLDGHTPRDRHRPHTRCPLPHQLRLRPDLPGQRCRYTALSHIVFELHARSISDPLKQLQAPRSPLVKRIA